jgi:hypothetical protein
MQCRYEKAKYVYYSQAMTGVTLMALGSEVLIIAVGFVNIVVEKGDTQGPCP